MRQQMERLMRFFAWIGGALAALLIFSMVGFMISTLWMESTIAAEKTESLWHMLPQAFKIAGFSVSCALAAEAISFPLAWSVAVSAAFMLPVRQRSAAQTAISAGSAIPAVVFGYLSLNYFVPYLHSAWWGVTVTLMLMSFMHQTLEILGVNNRFFRQAESAQALGATMAELILDIILPDAWKGYLQAALTNIVRCMFEGVAILMVLSSYDTQADTLATALMKSVGVTQQSGSLQWTLLLMGLMILLAELLNRLFNRVRKGGLRHGKANRS